MSENEDEEGEEDGEGDEVEGDEGLDGADDVDDEDIDEDDPALAGLEDEGSGEIKKEISQHQLELEKLKETDPSFYEYLMQNDQKLLDFEGEEDEDIVADDDDEEFGGGGKLEEVPTTILTREEWEKAVAGTEKVLLCYRLT